MKIVWLKVPRQGATLTCDICGGHIQGRVHIRWEPSPSEAGQSVRHLYQRRYHDRCLPVKRAPGGQMTLW